MTSQAGLVNPRVYRLNVQGRALRLWRPYGTLVGFYRLRFAEDAHYRNRRVVLAGVFRGDPGRWWHGWMSPYVAGEVRVGPYRTRAEALDALVAKLDPLE